MTAFITVTNASLAVDEAITSPQGVAFRDNPIAIAECDDTAPVNQAVWHPYDKVLNGDSNNGLIYDSAVSGAVTAVESPTFLSNFEYRFRFFLSGTEAALFFQGWNGSSWITVLQQASDTSTQREGFFELGYGLRVMVVEPQSGAASVEVGHTSSTGAAFPYTKMRLLQSGGPSFTGKVWLDKRRAYNV